ncbi:hypothetical protein ACFX13_039729 [Malus domestica]|uniref:Uncharacterized protein n=3 Tax=Maleae TaxID=721813 RepID=A0A498JSQ6_MALDO|nr:uncharacterized protein LOC126626263 [Malus sylvestris]KAB2633409.1 hypothetical protein D8674_029656 [Pyrus ussuriensis x Pyrus communis]RXH96271.1 hypothetical protein DVH24_008775 [Malus domestica]TQD88943.1 hypothetical protein C1H46_025535 [Malus baccata]
MNGDKANYETSWADQWDYNNNSTYPVEVKGDGGVAAKCKQKVGEGLVKTKAVASTGAKKVKVGASAGFHWIKEKCQKTTSKR